MKQINGWYLPDYDEHFLDPDLYESGKILTTQKYLRDTRIFVDIGAHIGIWSIKLYNVFDEIYAFEPDPLNFECLISNIESRNITNIVAHNSALSDYNGLCEVENLSNKNNSGNIGIIPGNNIKCATLDSFWLNKIDLIKIDIQGCEYKILLGAIKTITENDPVIFIEQTLNYEGRNFLKNYSYNLRQKIGKNYILQKEEKEQKEEVKKQVQEMIRKEKKIRKQKEKKKMEKRKKESKRTK